MKKMTRQLDPQDFLKSYPAQSVVLVCSRNGMVYNVAPYAWHMPISMDPPALVIGVRRSRDTYANIMETGEFVVSVPGPELVEDIDICARSIPRDRSEFDIAGLTPSPGKMIDTPGVLECQVNIECRTMWNKEAGDHDVIAGRIVHVSLADHLDPQMINRTHLRAVYHTAAGEVTYSRIGDPIR